MNLGSNLGSNAKNEGVSCEVRNCVYHDGARSCGADKITVGPGYANSAADTVCATFKHDDRSN